MGKRPKEILEREEARCQMDPEKEVGPVQEEEKLLLLLLFLRGDPVTGSREKTQGTRGGRCLGRCPGILV